MFHPWRHAYVTSRNQQKLYTVIFKSGHALEQYPKMKFRVRQSVRWVEHIPCLAGWFLNFLIISFADSLLTGSSDKYVLLIPKFSTIVSKYDLNVSAISPFSETTLSPSIRVILSFFPILLENKGFTVFQKLFIIRHYFLYWGY